MMSSRNRESKIESFHFCRNLSLSEVSQVKPSISLSLRKNTRQKDKHMFYWTRSHMWLHLHFQFTYFLCIYSEEPIANLSSEGGF